MTIMLGEPFLPAIIFPIGLVFVPVTLTLLLNAALKNVRVGPQPTATKLTGLWCMVVAASNLPFWPELWSVSNYANGHFDMPTNYCQGVDEC